MNCVTSQGKMSAWPSPLLWSLTTACLTGIALGQTTSTAVPVASTPAPASATSTAVPVASTPAPASATSTAVPVASTPAPASATSTAVPVASTPAPASATSTAVSAPPAATVTLPAGLTSTTANLVTSTAAPSADPSTKTPTQTLPTTTDVTILISGSTAASQASASTTAPVSPPGVVTSPEVPSEGPFLTTPTPSNCSRVNVTACARCPPGTFANQAPRTGSCKQREYRSKVCSYSKSHLITLCELDFCGAEREVAWWECQGTLSCSCCAGGSCTDPSTCSSCSPGHYQPQSGQPTCLPCPQGSYASFPRSTVCLPCPPGHFADESGAAACRACEPGYFSSKQNSAFCLPCLPGSFCNTTSCTVCLPCPGGQEAPREASEECVPCQPGTFKGLNDSRCKVCRTGEYQLQRGKESCDLCPENHYCPSPDVNPVKCPPDAFCPQGSTEPTYCMELFLYKAGNSCQLTPVMVVLLATFSAGGILVVFLVILRRWKDYGKKSLKSLLLPQGSKQHTTYGGMEHTEPVYAGW